MKIARNQDFLGRKFSTFAAFCRNLRFGMRYAPMGHVGLASSLFLGQFKKLFVA